MAQNGFKRVTLVAIMTTTAIIAADVARNLAVGSVDAREFALDKHEVTRDRREVTEFKTLLAALDDALRKDAVERYMSLNRRLHRIIERESRQARERASLMGWAARGETPGMMTAGGVSESFAAMELDTPSDAAAAARLAAATRRAEKMRRILERVSELEYGLERGEQGHYSRNAAMLDQFLKLMREDLAEVERVLAQAKKDE